MPRIAFRSLPLALACGLAGMASATAAPLAPHDPADLLALSIEDLGNVEVTATSRRASRLSDTPASVVVIRGDEIRSLGIRSLPEALRLAPNLHVARINAAGYAVAARGMKTSLSNKMLVMIDGRPVYTPLFAGVLWDMQAVPIEHIDRIEVVSGPGAVAWGPNAVNGVINIVTLPVHETRGGTVSAWAGKEGRGATVSQAVPAGSGAMRLYAQRTEWDATRTAAGARIGDRWRQNQAGFRGDWALTSGDLRLQGDAFHAVSPDRLLGPLRADGFNLTAQWSRTTASDARWSVLAYYDVVDRRDPVVLDDRMAIASIEVMQSRRLGSHYLTWGTGYREARDESEPGAFARLVPDDRTLAWAHLFAQDEIALSPRLTAQLGLRLDHNRYSGLEVLPTARLSWAASDESLLWAALSHAVRAPARFDREFYFPASEPYIIRGGPGFDSETVETAEVGYRAQPNRWLSFSLTGFHHRYDDLRGAAPAPGGGVYVANAARARSWGLEGWATVRVTEAWELSGGFIELRQQRELKTGFGGNLADLGNDPERQVLLRATRRLPAGQQVSAFARYVGALPAPRVPSYVQLDARWSWQPHESFELGVGVSNLLDESHAELQPSDGLAQSTFGRAAYVDVRADW